MVFTYPNLVTPTTCRVFPSLSEAVNTGQDMVKATGSLVRLMTKTARRDYLKRADTQWPCISLAEGINPKLRISDENPPALLHGFIADYDNCGKKFTNAELTDLASRCAYPPAAAGPSLGGDGIHAVWLFKEPIPCLGDTHYAKKITFECYKNLRVNNFIQGFDEAFKKPDRLLSIDPESFGWVTGSEEKQVVDEVSTRMWTSNVTKDFEFEGDKLDLVKVYEIIEKKYPGRWSGPFVVGARGVRFWDSTSSDQSAAVVTSTGMVYFTDGGGFKSWVSLLGNDVVSKLTAESLSLLTESWSYDKMNREYIYFVGGNYETKNRTQFMDRMELGGLDDEIERKRAIAYVEDFKGITAVVTLANQKRGLIRQNGLVYLNNTQTSSIVPEPGESPFLQNLLTHMFHEEQLHYFLAWLQDAVQCALVLEPSYAQSVFLAGSIECGKSLLQYRIITPLLGGKDSNPMDYLLGKTSFNSELGDSGHWLVSDSEGAKNGDQRANFTQRIKAITANPSMSIHQKYKIPVTLFLNARLTFSFNKTAECLSVIPRIGEDVLGKLSLFNIYSHHLFNGMQRKEIEETVARELPFFAHWLLNTYKPPQEVMSSGRYRTKSYHAPELLNYARAYQESSELLAWFHIMYSQNESLKESMAKPVERSAASWLQLLNATTGSNQGMTPNKLSTHLHGLARQYPEAIISRLDRHAKINLFTINYNKLIAANDTQSS